MGSLTHWLIDNDWSTGSLIPWPADSSIHWFRFSDSLIDWFIDSLVHWFGDDLFDWLFGWLVLWLTDSLIHWFIDPMIDPMIHRFIGSLIHWFIDSLIQWFVDSLVLWFIVSLLNSFIDSNGWLLHWFTDSLIHCLIGSSSDSLIHRFVPSSTRWFVDSFQLCAVFSCHVIGNSTAMCWFVDAPHNDYDASASQKSSYRPSSSYSGFLFAKLPPLRVPGTAGIPLYHFFCWLNPNSYLFLFQTNANFSLFNELLQNHGWSQTSPPQLSANCVAWRSQFRNLGVTTRNGARPFLLGKMLVPWPFQSFIWL